MSDTSLYVNTHNLFDADFQNDQATWLFHFGEFTGNTFDVVVFGGDQDEALDEAFETAIKHDPGLVVRWQDMDAEDQESAEMGEDVPDLTMTPAGKYIHSDDWTIDELESPREWAKEALLALQESDPKVYARWAEEWDHDPLEENTYG